MTSCTTLSDRMPDVALGRARWTADEERHLAACTDCRAEWAIVSTASRLGPPPTAATAPELVTRKLLERVRTDRAQARRRNRLWAVPGVAAAAMVAVAVWSQRSGAGGGDDPAAAGPAPVAAVPTPPPASQVPRGAAVPSGSALELAMPELDSLPEEALDSILRVLDEPLARARGEDAQVDDDGDVELERVLAGLEG